jgi:hypothetical protein
MTTQSSKKRKRTTSDRKTTAHDNKNITKAKNPLRDTAQAEETAHHSATKGGNDETEKKLVGGGGGNIKTFADLGLSQQLVNSLSAAGVSSPSELQSRIVPPLLKGEDVRTVMLNI